MAAEEPREAAGLQYRIGVASRLSGIPAHTLRKWEERHRVVAPARTASGERVYSETQVRYLTRLKALVDAGMEISILAGLRETELDAAAAAVLPPAAPRPAPARRPAVVAVGTRMPEYFRGHRDQLLKLDVRGAFGDGAALRAASVAPVDLLICEEDGIHAETPTTVAELLEASGAQAALVLYDFAPRWARDALRSPRLSLIRLPVEAADLQRLALGTWCDVTGWPDLGPRPEPAAPSPPRFSEASLMRITSAPVAMRCECPHHVADLLLGITSFERYSARCEAQQPSDAAEHRLLHATAASARVLFEQALVRLARAEGIATADSDA